MHTPRPSPPHGPVWGLFQLVHLMRAKTEVAQCAGELALLECNCQRPTKRLHEADRLALNT